MLQGFVDLPETDQF